MIPFRSISLASALANRMGDNINVTGTTIGNGIRNYFIANLCGPLVIIAALIEITAFATLALLTAPFKVCGVHSPCRFFVANLKISCWALVFGEIMALSCTIDLVIYAWHAALRGTVRVHQGAERWVAYSAATFANSLNHRRINHEVGIQLRVHWDRLEDLRGLVAPVAAEAEAGIQQAEFPDIDLNALVDVPRTQSISQTDIVKGARLIAREIAEGFSEGQQKAIEGADGDIVAPLMTKAIYLYAFGSHAQENTVPLFFKLATRTAIESLRKEFNQLTEEDKENILTAINRSNESLSSTSTQLAKNAFTALRGAGWEGAQGDMRNNPFFTYCWPYACQNWTALRPQQPPATT